jgi:outer membrane receptor protein involved in Fe transport
VRESQDQSNNGRYHSGAAYLRWRGLVAQRIAYDIGGRLDLIHYASLDRLTAGDAWQEETRLLASPKLGARYLLNDRIALLASLARGFRGAVGTIGDPAREPVVAWSKEVGATYQGQRIEGRVALFRFDVGNERILDPVTREVTEAGESVRQGVSLELSVTPAAGLRVGGEATWNDARITDAGAPAPAEVMAALTTTWRRVTTLARHDEPLEPGSRVPGVARYTGRIFAEAAVGRSIESRGTLRFSGPFTPIGEPNVRTQAYVVADLGATVPLGGGPRLDLDLLNVFDGKYPELRASGFLNPGAPRTLRLALRLGEPE